MNSTQRTVRAVVTTYTGPDGVPRAGLRGQVVNVGNDDLDAFDAAEGEIPPLPEMRSDGEVVPVNAEDTAGEEPPRSGKGSGVEAWTDYAASLGLEVPEGTSRDDVVALVDAHQK